VILSFCNVQAVTLKLCRSSCNDRDMTLEKVLHTASPQSRNPLRFL
jgi:hypothetical protein